MEFDLFTTLSFIIITSFTPGPNNISCASMGLNYGYKKTLPYIFGITSGFFFIMVICDLLTITFRQYLSDFEFILSIIGACYILYLAFHISMANYSFANSNQKPLRFINGMALQILNPKVIIYGLTIFSTFLFDVPVSIIKLVVLPLLFAFIAFFAVSTWAVFGNLIRKYVNNRTRTVLNIILALMLVYTALHMVNIV